MWILPTERENFSVAVLEAMAAGCTVLSTTCPGNDEVLIDRLNARTFGVGEVAVAARVLRELLADREQRERLCVEARRTAADYTADSMVEQYRRLYARSPSAPAVLVGGPGSTGTSPTVTS